jgi:hypothetical protein
MRVEEIKILISEGRIEEAIVEIVTLTKKLSSEQNNTAILLSGRFVECKNKKVRNINVDSEIAQINSDVIDLLDLIDETPKRKERNFSQEKMDFQRTIDIIVSQEKKEIKKDSISCFIVIICFCGLLCYNVISKNISKDELGIALILINIAVLLFLWFPWKQKVKREKTVIYFDKIIRIGISENSPEKDEYIGMVKKYIEVVVIP